MNDLFKALPDIINSASKGSLGILALLIVILGGLAYIFFRNSGEWVRSAIFLYFAAGAVLIGVVAFLPKAPSNPQPPWVAPVIKGPPVPRQEQRAASPPPVLHEVTVVLRNSSDIPQLLIDHKQVQEARYSSGFAALRVSSGAHKLEADYLDYVCRAEFTAPAPNQIPAQCDPK